MDEELDIELRSPAEVAIRGIVLASLIRRLSIESLASDRPDDALAGEAYDLRAWLQTENLWRHLDETEAAFLNRELGGLHEDAMAGVAWQVAGLAALGWTLGLTSLPAFGQVTQVESILEVIPSPWDATPPWIGSAVLRTEDEVARERERAELAEWRASIELPRRSAKGAERSEYVVVIAEVAREAESAGLAAFAKGDVLIDGRAVTELDESALKRLSSLCEERLRALNWVCGYGDAWSSVPLDV